MRYLSILTSMFFIAGLFIVGQAIGGGEYQKSGSQHDSSMSESQQKMDSQQAQQQPEQQQAQQKQQQQIAAGDLSNEQVKELQKSLNDRGFQSGPVDGIIGPKTKRALRNFQQFEGLTASGEPNRQTLEALDVDVEQQEFFGISPEFGQDQEQQQPEQQQQQDMQQQDMQQQDMQQQDMQQKQQTNQ